MAASLTSISSILYSVSVMDDDVSSTNAKTAIEGLTVAMFEWRNHPQGFAGMLWSGFLEEAFTNASFMRLIAAHRISNSYQLNSLT